jgi:Tfp pilus assembly protein PilN
MKITDAFQFLEKFAAKTVKKSAVDNELIVIEWLASGAVILHLDISSSPKIKRLCHLQFDSSLTENDRKNAYLQFFSLLGRKKLPKAVLLWSDGMTFRQLSIPEMPEDDLLKAFIWDLKKKYFYNVEDNLLGYKAVMDVEGAEAPEKLYDVFYCENKVALPRLNFLLGLGLDIFALVPSSVALARFTAKYEPVPEKDTLICELVEGAARIVVTREEMIMLSRNVTVGIPEAMFTDDMLNRVAEEIQKTIDFYESQKFSRPVGKVVFVGGCEPGRVLDFMTPKLSVPMAVPDLKDLLSGALDESDKQLVTSYPGLFAAAAGGALAPDETLNLVPDDIKTKNRQRKARHWLNLGLVVFGLALVIVTAAGALNIRWIEGRLTGLKKQYNEINKHKENLQHTLAKSRIRRAARKGDIPVRALLKELSLRTPALVVLRDVQYNRQEGTLSLAGDVVDAKRESMKTVTQFSASLSESVFIKSSEITNTNQDEANKVLQFEINCVVKGLS